MKGFPSCGSSELGHPEIFTRSNAVDSSQSQISIKLENVKFMPALSEYQAVADNYL